MKVMSISCCLLFWPELVASARWSHRRGSSRLSHTLCKNSGRYWTEQFWIIKLHPLAVNHPVSFEWSCAQSVRVFDVRRCGYVLFLHFYAILRFSVQCWSENPPGLTENSIFVRCTLWIFNFSDVCWWILTPARSNTEDASCRLTWTYKSLIYQCSLCIRTEYRSVIAADKFHFECGSRSVVGYLGCLGGRPKVSPTPLNTVQLLQKWT